MDLDGFDKRIRIYANKAGEVGDAAVKAASLATLQHLAGTTPVDTGKALSNWQVGIGASPPDILPALLPGENGSTADATAILVLKRGSAVIDGYTSGKGQAVHIVNNAKHIKYLNQGSSNKAPAGFIETAVAAGRRAIQNLRISFK